MSFQIHFRNSSNGSFSPAKRLDDENWIDTSFSDSPRAVGHLRLPGVSNGRYESKHPILDVDGTTVGLMLDGQTSLGYTFTCVYAGNCFWITHQTFGAVLRHVDISAVSLVDEKGRFLFSGKGTKFGVVKSFGFGGSWVNNIRAFKLLNNGASLLYLTNYGICLFDTRKREIVAKTDLKELAYQWSGFALSPKVNLLAIGFSARGNMDPINGEYRYRNFVRLYHIETGVAVGEQGLSGDRETQWTVDFSEDGRSLRVTSELYRYVFDLTVNP